MLSLTLQNLLHPSLARKKFGRHLKPGGYNSYGGQTNYYSQKRYSVYHEDRIEEFVEVKENGEIVRVKLH